MQSFRLTLKIAIPLIAMVVLIVLMAISSIVTLSIDKHAIAEVSNSVQKQRTLGDVELHYTKLLMAENSYALSGNSSYQAVFENEKLHVQNSLDRLKALPLTASEQGEVAKFQAGLDELDNEMHVLFGERYAESKSTVQEAVVQMDNSIAGNLADEIYQLTDSVEAEVESAIGRIQAADNREFWFTIVPVMIAIPIAIAVVFLTIYRISKPLLKLVEIAEKITMRDFSSRMKTGPLDEIGMLTRAFNAMAEEIERRYDELESFAYIVAHDLKNPISGIYGLSECVLDSVEGRVSDDEKEALESIKSAAESMNSLVTDLLEFARAGKVEFSKEPVPMASLLEDITKEMKFYIKERRAKVNIQGDLPSVYCDPIRFSQVWKNLIYNALKYNDKPEPTVNISVQKTGNGTYLFQVEDNGIGIDEKDYQSIFLPFKRAETDGKYEGTGIGLAIVKRVVDFHGGNIWVTSQKGQGTTFHLTVPRAHAVSVDRSHEVKAA